MKAEHRTQSADPFILRSFPRAIVHLDGDAFFTSVEQSLHPALKNRPVVTGQERGIIACASYEAKARGEKPTPATVDKQIAGIERSEAALRAIESVEATGGTAHYFSLDLRDADAVQAVVDDVRNRYGKIDVLLHAGGMLIDRTLPNKEPGQFNLVFDVKADVFARIFEALSGDPDMEYVCVDATIVKVHRHGHGAKGGLKIRP